MPTYIFYDKTTGNIVHVHREYLMDSEEPVKVDEKVLMEEMRTILPKNTDLGILATEESPKPVRGYRYYVDLNTVKLMMVERPPRMPKEKGVHERIPH